MDAVQDTGMDDRLTVAEAAARLGITKEAVRKRIHRGTLRSDKTSDGTVMVYVPPSYTESATPPGKGVYEPDLLYEQMRERIAYLERQVEEEREARRRADMLLARLVERVPELEAPQEPPGAPQRPPEGDGGGVVSPEPLENSERPWWRRVFGAGA